MERFGEKLFRLRTAHQLTLKELALALGYTAHGHISELEAGKKQPTAEFILRVARFFNVSTDQLLKDELSIAPVVTSTGVESIPMLVPLIERQPTVNEVEKIRLLLSTFQDGTGQLALPDGLTLPGWRDFERAVALVFNGYAQESKAIFDVLIPHPDSSGNHYGISCKMRGTLNDVDRTGRVTIELSNSSGKFWQALGDVDLTQSNYKQNAAVVGHTLITLITGWHEVVSIPRGGSIDVEKSCYLVLSWNKSRQYQLHQFPLSLPTRDIEWSFPEGQIRLVGRDKSGRLYEWYGESGGQLKYYPPVSDAIWASPRFSLEPLPLNDIPYGLIAKASTYFPDLWFHLDQSDKE